MNNQDLDSLVENGDILDYDYDKISEEVQGIERLVLYMPSGQVLRIETSCSDYQGNTKLGISLNNEDDAILTQEDIHAALNDVCEKCGRVYCDHENKY